METLLNLTIALAIGSLIGLERGWHEREAAEGTRIAGLRTFALVGLLGGLWGVLGKELGDILLGFAFLALVALMLLARFQVKRSDGDVGITTAVAMLITFTLGALAVRGYRVEASAFAVIVTMLLSLKPVLHHGLQRIEAKELRAFLQLLLISVVLLPVLPDKGMGPWNILNLYEIWWLVVLIAGISFAGYFAMKIVGVERGVLLTAFLGGLVSSTAVTINLSRLARNKALLNVIVAGVLLASATMFPRILFEVAVVNSELVLPLLLPMLAMFTVMLAGAAFFWRQHRGVETIEEFPVTRPLEIAMAIKFGLLLVGIILLAKGLQLWLGETGVYLLGVLSGVVDVDAVTLSLARMSRFDLADDVAVRGIVLAAMTNTAVKAALVFIIGGREPGWRVAVVAILTLVAGGSLVWLL